jgi:hypothetical protein
MFNAEKLGLMTDADLEMACKFDVVLDDTLDVTGSTKGQKAAQAALAAAPAATVFLPVAGAVAAV